MITIMRNHSYLISTHLPTLVTKTYEIPYNTHITPPQYPTKNILTRRKTDKQTNPYNTSTVL